MLTLPLPPPAAASEVRALYLHPGFVTGSATPALISTLLGSCVAIGIWDEDRRIGGMNHFLLPHFAGNGVSSARFGNVAVNQLITRLEASGARRHSMRARMFGGACVIEALRGVGGSLGRANVELARTLLHDAEIPIVSEDVEGNRGRKVTFRTDDGSCTVRLIAGDRHVTA